MQRKAIHRGGIVSAGYDPENNALEIEFEGKRVVSYAHVEPEVARRFLSGASPLSFFHDVIEEEYTATPVEIVNKKTTATNESRKKLESLFG